MKRYLVMKYNAIDFVNKKFVRKENRFLKRFYFLSYETRLIKVNKILIYECKLINVISL